MSAIALPQKGVFALGINLGDLQRPAGETLRNGIPLSRILGDLLAAVLGFGCALFGLFLVLFTDIAGRTERLQAWLYAAGVYAAAGFLLTLLWPHRRRHWWLWLGIPAVIVAARFALVEPGTALWNLAALGAAILGLVAGTAAAARLRPPSA